MDNGDNQPGSFGSDDPADVPLLVKSLERGFIGLKSDHALQRV
jgi:hypothetical protein